MPPERNILSPTNPVCERHQNLPDPRESSAARKIQPEVRPSGPQKEQAYYPHHGKRALPEHSENPGQRGEADGSSLVGSARTRTAITGAHTTSCRTEFLKSKIEHDHCYYTISVPVPERNADVESRISANENHCDVPQSVPYAAEQNNGCVGLRTGVHPNVSFGSPQRSSVVEHHDPHLGLASSAVQTDAERSNVCPTSSSYAGNSCNACHSKNDHNYVSQLHCTCSQVCLPEITKSSVSPTSTVALTSAKLSPRPGKRLPCSSPGQARRVLSFDAPVAGVVLADPMDNLTVKHEFTWREGVAAHSPEPSLIGFDLDLETETESGSGESDLESDPLSPVQLLSLVVSVPHGFFKALDNTVSLGGKARLRNGHIHTTNLSLYASRGAPCRSADGKLSVLNDRDSPTFVCNRTPSCATNGSSRPHEESESSLTSSSKTVSSPTTQGVVHYDSLRDCSVVAMRESKADAQIEDGDSEVEIIDVSSPPPSMGYRPAGRGRGGRRRRRGGHTHFRSQVRVVACLSHFTYSLAIELASWHSRVGLAGMVLYSKGKQCVK